MFFVSKIRMGATIDKPRFLWQFHLVIAQWHGPDYTNPIKSPGLLLLDTATPSPLPRSPMCIDLHTHSIYSDGTSTPAELVELAVQNGLQGLALTDHDTVEGVSEV